MRKRNNRIDIYLDDDEKNILINKSRETKLSYSQIIRKLIKNNNKYSYTKNEIEIIIDDLLKVEKYLRKLYCNDAANYILEIISKIKKE